MLVHIFILATSGSYWFSGGSKARRGVGGSRREGGASAGEGVLTLSLYLLDKHSTSLFLGITSKQPIVCSFLICFLTVDSPNSVSLEIVLILGQQISSSLE